MIFEPIAENLPLDLAYQDFETEQIFAPRGKHSAKPLAVKERLNTLFGTEPLKLEMFARNVAKTETSNWINAGNEVAPDLLDIFEAVEKLKTDTYL